MLFRSEVRAVVELDVSRAVIAEPQVGLVHERRRTEGVPCCLAREMSVRQPTQFLVDRRERLGYVRRDRVRSF